MAVEGAGEIQGGLKAGFLSCILVHEQKNIFHRSLLNSSFEEVRPPLMRAGSGFIRIPASNSYA
jgi:hypothetical protein